MEQNRMNTEQHTGGGNWNSEKAWESLHHRLDEDGLLVEEQTQKRFLPGMPAWRIAATILLVMAIGIPALYFGVLRPENSTEELLFAAGEEVRKLELPDGSIVSLNKNAELRYSGNFSKNRTLKLKGEAFFDVVSDPDHPFTVSAGNVQVSVLGTTFNVKNMIRSGTEVFVQSGKVSVSMDDMDETLFLAPGDLARTGKTGLTRVAQENPNYISWKTKEFIFVESDLEQVLKVLEESYHVKIHRQGADLSGLHISSTYKELSIDTILETIGTAFDFEIQKQNNEYYLGK